MEHTVKDRKEKNTTKRLRGGHDQVEKPADLKSSVSQRKEENGKTEDAISKEGEFFPHILIKNHVQTSRKKAKEKLLTKTNRGIKRSQSCEEGGRNQIPIFSPDKLGKKLSQKSTREILAWQSTHYCRMPKSFIPFISTFPIQ